MASKLPINLAFPWDSLSVEIKINRRACAYLFDAAILYLRVERKQHAFVEQIF